jgi:TPR repeat protein
MRSIRKSLAGVPMVGACLVLGLLLVAPQAGADAAKPLRKADKALAAGDYDRAYQEYLRHAEENDNPLAQFNLALFYEFGWGRAADPEAACRWHERAAAGGIPYSSHRLAECLAQGVGRPADPQAAARWYRTAADLGHYISLCDLAELYMRGEGVDKDPREGIALCTQAAGRNLAQAQLRLANFYLEGDASIRDPALAGKWLEAAASQGLPAAQHRLGTLLRAGAGDNAATLDAARFWLESAASQGYLPAYLPVGELYLAGPRDPDSGLLPADDLAKAYLWLSAAARALRESEAQSRASSLLARVREVMPQSWAASLDAQVDVHLAEHPQKP